MQEEKQKMQFSIRIKLFFFVFIGFTTFIVATSWQIGVQADKVSIESINRSLNQSSVVLNTKIDSRFTSIKEVATGIAKDSRVLPLVFDGEALTLQDLSQEFRKVLEFDVLFFLDAEGTILARSDRPEAIGRNMAGKSELFDTALSGELTQGIIVIKGRPLQIVVMPIFDNVAKDVVRGVVALAYEISKNMAEEIHALTASDIGVFVFSRGKDREINGVNGVYNTNNQLTRGLEGYFSTHPDDWTVVMSASSNVNHIQMTVNGEDYYTVVHRLNSMNGRALGFVIALQSRTELLKPFLDIRRTVTIIGLICLFLASILAWLFALRISRPILKLVSVAKSIQDGECPESESKYQTNDEIGVLYNAVVTMGNTLKEKAELESYLAQLSNDLDVVEAMPGIIEGSTFVIPGSAEVDVARETQAVDPEEETLICDTLPENKGESQPLDAGKIIDGRYEIVRSIGSGAMGAVFLAHDIDLDENVAIKVMMKELFSRQESISFKEEIRLARRITHRNILRTFDFGSWGDFYYITMEYVSGHDLGLLLKTRGAFSVHIGVAMARQVCSAMNAAHEQGIIHRDLKPSNMMINRQGILKIMDFGLAMKLTKSDDASADAESNKPTVIAGTPKYMAPEQFFGWPLDERTDTYAIGAILYAIFDGKPPFNARGFDALAELHLNKVPSALCEKDSAFPNSLKRIVAKALSKNPEDRYQTVRQMLDDLDAV